MGRSGRWKVAGSVVVAVAMAMAAFAVPAWGDDSKKKPGLFDFAPWRTPAGHERDAARQLAPGKLDLTGDGAETGPLRTVRLRVYADRDYRMIVLRWQHKLRAQIERINAVVAPLFAVRFELESLREWDSSHTGAAFEAILVDLEARDPARDVDWVLGLVTPLRGVAASAHQVGGARMLSRHLVMRGMDDEQEILALERELKLLSPDERQGLYGDRKAHKEVVMFLHEWGHTLGLLHHETPTAIMNPSYDPRQAAFSAFERRVAALVIAHRLERPQEAFPESADLATLLADTPDDEGSDKDRAQLLGLVRQRARAGEERPGGTGPPAGVSADDVARFNRAVEAANAGRSEAAWTELGPLAHRLETTKAESSEARLAARSEREGLGTPPRVPSSTKASTDATFTLRVAELAAHVGALTAAESLLARAQAQGTKDDPAARKLAGEIESTRHRIALPAGATAGVPPERESAFVAGFHETTRLIYENAPAARARFAELAAAFPDAPGVDVLACDLEQRAKKRAVAGKRCEAALAKFDGATRAMTLLGLLAAQQGRQAVAEKHLRRAILLDPGDPGAWQILAQVYRATHARQQLKELANQHQALLSSPLPE